MGEPYLASIRGEVRDFKWMLNRVGIPSYSSGFLSGEIYLVIYPDRIEAYSHSVSPKRAYCTFTDSYFDGITIEGGSEVTAIVYSGDLMQALKKCDTGDFVELRFLDDGFESDGTIHSPRASMVQLRNVLTHQILCPVFGPDDLGEISQRFAADDTFLDEGGRTPVPVHISIPADQMERFTSIIDGDDDSIVYPLVVRDEKIEFTFFPDDDDENWVHGELAMHSAEGPDVKQHYPKYLGLIFEKLTGDIDLYTDPEEGLLAIVNRSKMGSTLRYVVPSVDIDIDDSPLKWV